MTRKRQHIGSHNTLAVPDDQMGRLGFETSPRARRGLKKTAAKKRRQRDKREQS